MAIGTGLNAVAGNGQRHQVDGVIGILITDHHNVARWDNVVHGTGKTQRLCLARKPYTVQVEFAARSVRRWRRDTCAEP